MDNTKLAAELVKLAKQLTSELHTLDSDAVDFSIKNESPGDMRLADDPTEEAVIEFLSKNKNPSDDVVHKWAEDNGYEVPKVETAIYSLATKYADFAADGRAHEKGVTEADVNKDELAMGVEVEMEHTPDVLVTRRIALDHLAEATDAKIKYYTILKIMEKIIEKSVDMDDSEVNETLKKLSDMGND